MVETGREWSNGRPIFWAEGDALHLPFSENSFDAVLNGFMLRNVVDVRATLAEQTRVVRPGGRVVCLEMTWPRSPLFRPLFRLYFAGIVPIVGRLLTGYREAYRYLPHSVEVFMSPDELASTMEQVGLTQVRYRSMMMKTVTLHVGVKGSD
jgi:demethylmenaquinone methyltransferase/2-methoxy-6-polyprenyl-1,4-benzoquinol methylase